MSTTTPYEIPLTNAAQKINIALGGTTYALNVVWNDQAQVWVVDISDTSGNLIIGGIPLVTGVDLLGQYEYLDFGGQLVAQTDFDLTAPPSYTNLGSTGHLYFLVTS